ncbi:terminase small subunit [Cupriavidus alkaliphilus]|uniref:Phage terminase small subunit n=1 Tax=Cupriavidus alkaliphilus TaxID=942866 RepID=A0A7W4VFH5_9BURK|nr:terminase small subunit [Cupriavidus alkaliphilus]MBB3010641.1 phage terminase small subunit [Cupriavidus alkaliphilus]
MSKTTKKPEPAKKPAAKKPVPKAPLKTPGPLSERHKRFCDEYLIDLNGAAAYQRAGFKAKGNVAEVNSARLLRNAQIKSYLNERNAERQKRTEITADRVLKEMARLAFFDPRRLFRPDGSPLPINELDDETAAALAGLEVLEEYEGHGEDRVFVGYTKKYKIADKTANLANLARHFQLFVDKTEVKVVNELSDDELDARILGYAAKG